jgi:hypothetical protein
MLGPEVKGSALWAIIYQVIYKPARDFTVFMFFFGY